MCLLILLAVLVGLAIWRRTQNPVVAILATIVAWWMLRFLVTYMILMALLNPDWEDGCDHTAFC